MLRRCAWLVVGFAALSGCGRSTRVETGTRDQILHIGSGAEPNDIDPNTNRSSVEYTLDSALFEGLVDMADDGNTILPGVAKRWDVSPDGRLYTFHLRPEARWSDGTPLTAGDFLYSFRRIFTPALACEGAVYGYAIAGAADFASGRTSSPDSIGMRVVDAETFEIRLDHRQPYFLTILAGAPFQPVPRAVVERFGGGTRPGTAWTRPGNMVSNGPFMLSAWHPNQDLVVVRNPFYWDSARVRLREIRFYPIDNADTEESAFRAGQLHVTFTLPLGRISAYRARSDPRLHVTPQLNTDYLFFNTARRPFDDVRIRRAFSLAIDRELVVPRVLQDSAAPAHSLTRPGTGGYLPPPAVDHDPAEARRLLTAAGFPGGVGFPAVEFKVSGLRNRRMAEALQEVWRKELGVHVSIAAEEEKTLFDDGDTGNFQMAAMGFFYAINAPETVLLVPVGTSRYNFTGWKDSAYDAAYARALGSENGTDRKSALDAMERILGARVPLAPLFFINQPFLVDPDVKGWRDNPIGAIDWRELRLGP